MANKTRITIKDVARAAGCGVATASRVLNKSGSASSETRERVEQAARDLGFAFSATGRALQSRRSMTVGCLIPSLANPVLPKRYKAHRKNCAKRAISCWWPAPTMTVKPTTKSSHALGQRCRRVAGDHGGPAGQLSAEHGAGPKCPHMSDVSRPPARLAKRACVQRRGRRGGCTSICTIWPPPHRVFGASLCNLGSLAQSF